MNLYQWERSEQEEREAAKATHGLYLQGIRTLHPRGNKLPADLIKAKEDAPFSDLTHPLSFISVFRRLFQA